MTLDTLRATGERVFEADALTLRHFLVHTVAHELLHVDGTLWRTLRLLFTRPGQFSLEYAAGRRRHRPLRSSVSSSAVHPNPRDSALVVETSFWRRCFMQRCGLSSGRVR